MLTVLQAMREGDVGEILPNEPLSRHTTWKIGGPADLMVIPGNKEQLARCVSILQANHVPWMSLGRGSNMLVSDKGIRGVVIKLGKSLDYIRVQENKIIAGGAYGLIKMCVVSSQHGLKGLEFLGGIPGSVGGAVYMNAGAHGSDISRVLLRAEVLLNTGELVVLGNEEMKFAYRHSVLQEDLRGIVTEAEFGLIPGDREAITKEMSELKARRLRTQPLQSASAGSVFRNPGNHFAAKLIEEAGLKGLRVGGAEISTQHANFIVNTGGASAKDVLTLIDRIQGIVQEKYGIRLVPEVRMVGEW